MAASTWPVTYSPINKSTNNNRRYLRDQSTLKNINNWTLQYSTLKEIQERVKIVQMKRKLFNLLSQYRLLK